MIKSVLLGLLLSLAVLGGFFAIFGLWRVEQVIEVSGEDGMPKRWKFTLPKGDASEGRKVFVEMECYKCHEVKGEKFPSAARGEREIGPELSQMEGMHPVEFFAESIINPNAVIEPEDKEKGYLGEDRKSKMPDYSDLLTVKQLADLATYLANLQGEKHKRH